MVEFLECLKNRKSTRFSNALMVILSRYSYRNRDVGFRTRDAFGSFGRSMYTKA